MSTPTQHQESPPAIELDGPVARVTFDRFTMESYPLFLATKQLPESALTYDWERDAYVIETAARFAPLLGVQAPPVAAISEPLAGHLFDYQRWAVQMALDAKRFALWCDTGLGKGPMCLEWCRQVHLRTNGRVLILEPLAVIPQLVAEADRFYGADMAIRILNGRDDLRAWCQHGPEPYAIANYEKFVPKRGESEVVSELRYVAGIAADESSILRTGGGTIKWALIKSARGVEYKLSCTATPAPNEAMEYASQAAFLEKLRTEGDILWTYFQRDKYGTWFVKPHARQAFYRFMASWSLYMRNPATFGFGDILASLPSPVMHEERVPLTDDQRALMTDLTVKSGKGFIIDDRLSLTERSKFAQIARGFIYQKAEGVRVAWPVEALKPAMVGEIARQRALLGDRILIWTSFDEEGEIILRNLGMDDAAILTGSQSQVARERILAQFRAGEITTLISKPSLIGYGLNLQFVRSMIFSGIDDSMERRYQAIRRAYRFGQTEPVHVWTVYVPELEGVMFDNVAAKEARFLDEVAAQERMYRRALGMDN